MSGLVVFSVQKRVVDFATLAASATEDLILTDRVDLLLWREVDLRVQVYSHSLASGAGSISIIMLPQSFTPEDPGLAFVDPTAAATAAIVAATPTPAFLSMSATMLGTHGIAAMTRIIARGSRTSPGALNATLSVQLAVKDS